MAKRRPRAVGRNFIERALERAIGVLQADAEIDPTDRDLAIDRDTLDVPGPSLTVIINR